MFKLFGGVLLATGAVGFSLCICKELKVRLLLLKEVRYMYLLIQNEIRYTGLPIPMVLENIADKIRLPFRTMLKNISGKVRKNEGEMLAEIWERECINVLAQIPFTGEQKKSVLRFPECFGMIDPEGQAKSVQYRIEELDSWIEEQEKVTKENGRVIMSLGIGAGAFAMIILL